MKKICIAVLVGSGALGLGWLGGVDYLDQRNVGTLLVALAAVWVGYMAGFADDQ
jgi:hypothetical protein